MKLMVCSVCHSGGPHTEVIMPSPELKCEDVKAMLPCRCKNILLSPRHMSSNCPPLSDIGDAKVACHQHCRNAVAPYVAPHRWTPLRPQDFEDCMASCRTCTASRTLWNNCVENALASHPTYTALAQRNMEQYFVQQCSRY